MKFLIVQSETRDAPYLTLTRRSITEIAIPYLNNGTHEMIHYDYKFIDMTKCNLQDFADYYPACWKVVLVKELLDDRTSNYDGMVFLDSDAWINSAETLHQIIQYLMNQREKHGCFSRDPCKIINTYINSGSFILKFNDYTRKMYSNIMDTMRKEPTHSNAWPYDQYYISDYVFNNRNDFIIFHERIMNTPQGFVLRHNWWKNGQLYIDLYNQLDGKVKHHPNGIFTVAEHLDNAPFPNKDDSGSDYQY